MNNRKIKIAVFYLTLICLIVQNIALLCKIKSRNVSLTFCPLIAYTGGMSERNKIGKRISSSEDLRVGKSKSELRSSMYDNTLNYKMYVPPGWNISSVRTSDGVIEISNFPLNNYSIISIDYGYSFMGLCMLCKNKYIYEKVMARHKSLINTTKFDLPIRENVVLFYAIHFKSYIYNFLYLFQHLFEFVYNSNLLVIIGCNGPHMNRLSSDMGRRMCYFMNEINGKRENFLNKVPFDAREDLITIRNDNIYKRDQINYAENYIFNSNEKEITSEEHTDDYLHFSLKNVITKVKDENNTLFSRFYNKNCKNRRDSLSACYLAYYFLKYYSHSKKNFLLPSRNVNYVYHVKK
ncbi:conserved Plasmodium protein, unknown function [Plasmodium ovale]|uniref:Uncharacterized protein n=1 Tax=Plasmodium ovale TaxID=36330 RepID=A0A1D3TJF0_PLAOA|nr:conserved Plasmodium protein, unknown function [Plasmodium ovale]